MKRLFYILLTILLFSGIAYSANVPEGVDSTAGPEVWLTEVYNNYTTELGVGDLVVWDFDSATGDNDNYVTATTTADTFAIAGIVYPSAIPAVRSGTIAIRGVVAVDLVSSPGHQATTNSLMCSSTTATKANRCSSTTSDSDAFGFLTTTPSTTSGTVYLFGR